MKRKLQFLLMILSLCIFMMPAQNLFAKTQTMDCCKTENAQHCHKTDTGKQLPQEKHKSCDGACCAVCSTCGQINFITDHFEIFAVKFFNLKNKKEDFSYREPIFFIDFKEIWQPPKIA